MRIQAALLSCWSATFSLVPAALGLQEPQEQAAEQTADQTTEAIKLLEEGRQALTCGDLKAAKKAFREALKLDRRLPLANFALGLAYHLEDDYKNAAKYYRKETQYHPLRGEAYLNWGACAAMMNRHPRAVLAFVEAVSRLGAEEAYVNNLGKAVYALRQAREDEAKLAPELQRALETYTELEAYLNAKLAAEGMTRWGSTKITLDQKRDLEEQAMRLEQMIQDQTLQIQDYVFEANTVRHRINQLRMNLREYREAQARRGELDAEMTRLELRLRDLEDNMRLARANIKRLEDQKPKPPWNEDYAIANEIPAER